MTIFNKSLRVSREDSDFSPCTASTGEDYKSLKFRESEGCGPSVDVATNADSGMCVDEFDSSEFGEPGTKLCQVGNKSFSFPLELFELSNFGSVISLQTWNECLTEEERFALAKYLPDMDQGDFAMSLKELFSGSNLYFGSPLTVFLNQLKGGFYDSQLVLYRQGLNIFERCKHCHQLRTYHDSMIRSLVQMRETWKNSAGCGTEGKLPFLNTTRSQSSLDFSRNGDLGSKVDFENGRFFSIGSTALHSSRASADDFGKEKLKGSFKVTASMVSSKKDYMRGPGFDLTNSRVRGADEKHFDWDIGLADRADRNGRRGTTVAKYGTSKQRRKGFKKYDEDMPIFPIPNSLDGSPDRSTGYDQTITVAFDDSNACHRRKKLKQSKDLKRPAKGRLRHQGLKGSQVDWSNAKQLYPGKLNTETSSPDYPSAGDVLRTSKSSFGFDSRVDSCKGSPAQTDGSNFHTDYRTKNFQGKLRNKSLRSSPMSSQNEEAKSVSSGQVEQDGNVYPFASTSDSIPEMEFCQSGFANLSYNLIKSDNPTKSKTKVPHSLDGGMSGQEQGVEPYSRKVKQRGNLYDGNSVRKGQVTHFGEMLTPASLGFFDAVRNKRLSTNFDHSLELSSNMCNHGRGVMDGTEGSLEISARLTDLERTLDKSQSRSRISTDYVLENVHHERSSMPILGCNSEPRRKKYKGIFGHLGELNEPVQWVFSPLRQIQDSSVMKKKGKRKARDQALPPSLSSLEPIIPEKEMTAPELEIDMKRHKKPFILIKPTIHTGFSFSIIHLLSAVRKAFITTKMEDTQNISLGEQKKFLHMSNGVLLPHCHDHLEGGVSQHERSNLPSLKVQEIVDQVRSNPGDPRILETAEPLQDLVRGVLKVFSSKTSPLGATGWKALVIFEKSNKRWSWLGRIPSSSSYDENAEEEASAEAWGIPHAMLVKFVDDFANWLKNGQETLQQIGSLPAPPALFPVLDYKDRFKDLGAQKSLKTISTSSEEVTTYFQLEERLRYSMPDRAFQYTAIDGRKSIVAPLKRGGGKPTFKVREHPLLKPNRPPHVTILCLVRDAAARLPGSIGTRADVCTLIKDSQYFVENATDAQVSQVVSGALDRLHYELDPCVQFDGDRKLWAYLHRNREEEDFEDDGTSSKKQWKISRKDNASHPIDLAMNGSHNRAKETTSSSSEFDLNLDLKTDSSVVHVKSCEEGGQSSPMSWALFGGNPLQKNKMLCQVNSTKIKAQ